MSSSSSTFGILGLIHLADQTPDLTLYCREPMASSSDERERGDARALGTLTGVSAAAAAEPARRPVAYDLLVLCSVLICPERSDVAPHMGVTAVHRAHPGRNRVQVGGHLALTPGHLHDPAIAGEVLDEVAAQEQ